MELSWIDIIILVVLFLGIILGFVRGFVKSLASLTSFVLAILIANRYYIVLREYIKSNTTWDEKIYNFFSGKVATIGLPDSGGSWIESINLYNFPEGAKDFINKMVSSISETGSSAIDNFSYQSTDIILNILSFILIFFSVKIIIMIIVALLDVITKVPVLNLINRIAGTVIGFVEGIIFNVIIVSLIYTFALFAAQELLINAINNSLIAQYFYIGYIFY